MAKGCIRIIALSLALACLGGGEAFAEEYSAYGYFVTPQSGAVYQIPMGQINTTVVGETVDHGFTITGNPNQVIPLVLPEIELQMPGQLDRATWEAPQNINLGPTGSYTWTDTIRVSRTLTAGLYQATLRSQVFVGGVSKSDFPHTHNFQVTF